LNVVRRSTVAFHVANWGYTSMNHESELCTLRNADAVWKMNPMPVAPEK
jgi:hypothetical protein